MVSREKQTLLIALITSISLFILIFFYVVWLILSSGASKVTYNDPKVAYRVVRGTIYDRNGEILAIETPYHSLALHISKVEHMDTLVDNISPIIGMSSEEIWNKIKGKTHYALIKTDLLTDQKSSLEKLIASNKLRGAVIEKRYKRVYPQSYHASTLIGFTNSENVGLEGLEYSYNKTLLPYPGLNEDITYGDDLYLTIDMNIQYMLDFNIQEMVNEHSAQSAVGIIMEAKSGAILASSSYPWYDPGEYASSDSAYYKNSFVTDMREPGSVFKIFSLAAELDSGAISKDESFFCDGSYLFIGDDGNKTTINCTSSHGQVNPLQMIAKSCNGAVAHWSHKMSKETFVEYLEKFGFTTRVNLPISGIASGYLSPPSRWSDRSKATISFGQEIAVTPIQIVHGATALANKGNIVSPYLVSSITSKEGKVLYKKETKTPHPIIGEDVAQTVLQGMEKATDLEGTATKSRVEGVRVGSKTGTAQVANPDGGGYLKNTYLASTLSIFPLDDPQYIIYVAALDPKGNTIWGSSIASPAIGNIIRDMVRVGYVTSSEIQKVTLDN